MSLPAEVATLTAIPRDVDGPVFGEPWQAQAFAMTLMLHERGHFTWKEWADRLAREIAAAKARGERDDGTHYYEYWLAALEKLVADKGLLNAGELLARKDAWETAARATPHGKPIELRAPTSTDLQQ